MSSARVSLATQLDEPVDDPPPRPAAFSGEALGEVRLGGTSIPRLFAVGTFSMGSPRRRSFLDLRRASKEVVVLELENCGYDLVMVEVGNADRALKLIAEAKESCAAETAE